MGYQRLARQMKSQPLRARFASKVCHGPGHIDECDIPRSELHGLIVLGHH